MSIGLRGQAVLLTSGTWGRLIGLERPMRTFRIGGVRGGSREFGALIDPGAQQIDLRGCQRLAHGRHAETFFGARYALDQLARGAIAGRHYGAGIAAFEQSIRQVDAESADLLLGTVAARAACGEDGLDVAVEIDGFGLGTGLGERTAENHRPKEIPHRLLSVTPSTLLAHGGCISFLGRAAFAGQAGGLPYGDNLWMLHES